MSSECLYAYTGGRREPHDPERPYVGYLSINQRGVNVVASLRGTDTRDGVAQDLVIPRDELVVLRDALTKYIKATAPPCPHSNDGGKCFPSCIIKPCPIGMDKK